MTKAALTRVKPRIVVVGSINMDLVVQADRMPLPGETVMGKSFTTIPGGKGANQAVAAVRLGAVVHMIGRVGDDAFGQTLRDALGAAGVDITHVLTTPNCSSGIAAIGVDNKGENAITVVSGANHMLRPQDIEKLESVIAQANVMLVQLESPIDTIAMALKLARRHNVYTLLDPAPVPDQPLPDELFEVDIISPNQTEAKSLASQQNGEAGNHTLLGKELIRRGAKRVVMKLGAQGAMMIEGDGQTQAIPAFPTKVVDTTAAGDAFTAGLAVGIGEGMTLAQAVRLGCAAGSKAASAFGAQQSMATREQVEQILRQKQ